MTTYYKRDMNDIINDSNDNWNLRNIVIIYYTYRYTYKSILFKY